MSLSIFLFVVYFQAGSVDINAVLTSAQGISFRPDEIENVKSEIAGKNMDEVVTLAVNYVKGEGGVDKDGRKAAALLLIAANAGHPDGQTRLGYLYHQGIGFVLSYKEAFGWVKKAAEQGYAKAEYNLGLMYGNGQGVALSNELASEWLRRAANNDYQEAKDVLKQLGEEW